MTISKGTNSKVPRILATDLDGTLIPLPNNSENTQDLKKIARHINLGKNIFIFATGRPFKSTLEALEIYALPKPHWLICDVGASIYSNLDGEFKKHTPYETYLRSITKKLNRNNIELLLSDIPHINLQTPENQTEFKISYRCETSSLERALQNIRTKLCNSELPFDCLGSVDPFENCGLIDILPKGIHKSAALNWLAQDAQFETDEIVYSGDSGNDYAALTFGYRSILVSNASDTLAARVETALQESGLSDHLFKATKEATSGVLEGWRHFGVING
ncbi:MAG: HAD-IIB family hydrolase [Opitutales bacterium]